MGFWGYVPFEPCRHLHLLIPLSDWKVHLGVPLGGVLAEPNQLAFQSTLELSSQFDHGVIALQHDNSREVVDLAIGYTLPFLLGHSPAFDIKPVMQCQGRPTGDMYNETLSNQDGPWSGSGDVATRSSNVGFDEISSVPPLASRTYVTTGTRTATAGSRNAGFKSTVDAHDLAAVVVAFLAAVLTGEV